jgi:hypothetical protein
LLGRSHFFCLSSRDGLRLTEPRQIFQTGVGKSSLINKVFNVDLAVGYPGVCYVALMISRRACLTLHLGKRISTGRSSPKVTHDSCYTTLSGWSPETPTISVHSRRSSKIANNDKSWRRSYMPSGIDDHRSCCCFAVDINLCCRLCIQSPFSGGRALEKGTKEILDLCCERVCCHLSVTTN